MHDHLNLHFNAQSWRTSKWHFLILFFALCPRF
jgi:hypothetical protein